MCDERICCARFWRWHVPHVSISLTLARLFAGETLSITRWQLVHATSLPACALPAQNRRSPFALQSRQIAVRTATGVGSFRAIEADSSSTTGTATSADRRHVTRALSREDADHATRRDGQEALEPGAREAPRYAVGLIELKAEAAGRRLGER